MNWKGSALRKASIEEQSTLQCGKCHSEFTIALDQTTIYLTRRSVVLAWNESRK